MPFVNSVHIACLCQYLLNVLQYVLTVILYRMAEDSAAELICISSFRVCVACLLSSVEVPLFGVIHLNMC